MATAAVHSHLEPHLPVSVLLEDIVCVCVCVKQRERENVCVCVCVLFTVWGQQQDACKNAQKTTLTTATHMGRIHTEDGSGGGQRDRVTD